MNQHPHEIAMNLLNEMAINEARRRPRTYPHIARIRNASRKQLLELFNELPAPKTLRHLRKFKFIINRIKETRHAIL